MPDDVPDRGAGPSALVGSLVLILLVLPLYVATMVEGRAINVDAEAAALPAWHLAQHGTVDLSDVGPVSNPWIIETDDGRLVSNRPPGLSAVAVPAYLLAGDASYSGSPSTVTAVVVTLLGVLVVHLVLRRCLPPAWALGGALTLAVGTATWPIAAAQLWPHGPGQLLFALVMLALASGRRAVAGVAAAAEVLVRPVAVVAPIALGLRAAARRQWRAAAAILIPVGMSSVAVVAFNAWAFGSPSVSGGYGPGFRDNLTDMSSVGYVKNVLAVVASPHNGLLVWSPVLVLAILGLRRAWPALPDWARGGAIGGLAYLLVHARLNRASGGLPFDYRYPLEPLALAAPALVVATRAFVGRSEARRLLLVAALAASVILQGLVAFTLECEDGPPLSNVACSLG